MYQLLGGWQGGRYEGAGWEVRGGQGGRYDGAGWEVRGVQVGGTRGQGGRYEGGRVGRTMYQLENDCDKDRFGHNLHADKREKENIHLFMSIITCRNKNIIMKKIPKVYKGTFENLIGARG